MSKYEYLGGGGDGETPLEPLCSPLKGYLVFKYS